MRNPTPTPPVCAPTIARDQWRLNEALRCGRSREAARMARHLARDRQAQRRDYRHGWR